MMRESQGTVLSGSYSRLWSCSRKGAFHVSPVLSVLVFGACPPWCIAVGRECALPRHCMYGTECIFFHFLRRGSHPEKFEFRCAVHQLHVHVTKVASHYIPASMRIIHPVICAKLLSQVGVPDARPAFQQAT